LNTKPIYVIGFITQSLFYIAAGVNHFWHSSVYVAVMPTHYTHLHALVWLSGAAEFIGGLGLLFDRTRRLAAFGLIAMLVVYFDVHIFMLSHPARFPLIPFWVLEVRIPLQFLLITWAAVYAAYRHANNDLITPQVA
jgi:uncharacterized membrane protein